MTNPAAPLRVLQIGDDWAHERPGGLGRYFLELMKHLPATGTHARGLVVGSTQVTSLTGGVVTAYARPDAPLLARLHHLRCAVAASLRESPANILVFHFALYALPLLDRIASTPSVVHFHGPWAAESNAEQAAGWNARTKAAIERRVYQRARRLIVLSHSFREELVRRYAVPEDCVRVIPAGIDAERFNMNLSRADARDRLGWPQDRPVVLTIRRLVRRVGLENLIYAARIVLQQHPDALFLLGGSGPLAEELRQRIAEHGLEHSIQLLGRVPDVDLPTAYRAADLSVVPSQALEGFGLTTLESLACGTPVYVTPIGGLPELIRPFAPGCVFADPFPQAIAAGLSDALSHAVPVPSPESCRTYAVSHFAWPNIALRVRDVYQEALA